MKADLLNRTERRKKYPSRKNISKMLKRPQPRGSSPVRKTHYVPQRGPHVPPSNYRILKKGEQVPAGYQRLSASGSTVVPSFWLSDILSKLRGKPASCQIKLLLNGFLEPWDCKKGGIKAFDGTDKEIMLWDFQEWLVAGTVSEPYLHGTSLSQKSNASAKLYSIKPSYRTNAPPTEPHPHICSDCGKGFPTRSELNRHCMIHTGLKPHKCRFCERCFRQKAHLKSHMIIHHTQELQ